MRPANRRLAVALSAIATLVGTVIVTRLAADVASTPAFRWVTDAPVAAAAGVDDTVYLGGAFSYVGLATDDAPSFLQQSNGALLAGCATRTGVQTGVRPIVVPDASGGLFMQVPVSDERLRDSAGDFEVTSGESFVRIGTDCRFLRNFRLESFVPNDTVTRGLTIVRVGSLIYVGGTRSVGLGNAYGRVAAYNGATGARVNAWDYERFRTVLIDGVTPGGQLVVTTTPRSGDGARQEVGVLAPATGAFALLATIESTGFVAVSGSTLYVTTAANRALQALDLTTGQPKAGWTSPVLTANDIEVGNGRVFVAGTGLGRRGVFAIAETTGTLVTAFAPDLGAPAGGVVTVERLALVNDRLFLRGRTIRTVAGATRYLLGAVNAASGAADPWAPLVFAPTASSIDLVPLEERLYVGRVTAATVVERRHLAAVNTETGAILPFNPNAAAGITPVPTVSALALGANALFVGTVQGHVRRVGLATGGLEPWVVATAVGGSTPGTIATLAVNGDAVYAGGLFTAVTTSGQGTPVARGHGVAIGSASGAILPWDPRVSSTATNPAQPRRPISSLSTVGDTIVIGGDFTAVAGETRAGIAAVDRAGGATTLPTLTLEAGKVVLDSVVGVDQVYFVGVDGAGAPLIGVADPLSASVTEWTVLPETAPTSRVAYSEGLVYSGPEWEADTGIVLSSSTPWRRPVAVPAGLLELEEPVDGADGPYLTRFHAASEGGSVGAPRDLTVLYAGTDVYLSWRAPLRGAVESYVIRAGPASGQSSLANLDTGTPATAYWTRAPEGVYFVRVHARGADGISGASNEVSFALVPFGCNAAPRAPGTLTASTGDDRVMLAWGSAIGAASYRVEAGSRTGASDVTVLNVGNRLLLETLAPPGRYFVRTRGVNGCGQGTASNEVVVTIGGPPPQPPANLRGRVDGRTVTLEWDAPTVGEPPTFFQLEAGSAPGLANLAVSRTAERRIVVTNVAPGTYYVRTRAGNAAGVSDPTADTVVSVQ